MRTVLSIFITDLRRRLKKPLSVILMMCIPLAMTVIIGSVFGRQGGSELPRITMLLVDEDESMLSMFISQAMGQGDLADMVEVVRVERPEGERMMDSGEASAMVVIPDSFTIRVLDGETAVIEVVKNPSESFLPMIIEELTATFAVLIDGGMKAFGEILREGRDVFTADRWPKLEEMQALLDEARAGYALAGPYLTDSLITLEESVVREEGEEEDAGGGGGINVFSYVMSGSLMIGLLFTSNIMLRDIVRERQSGTLARILSSPSGTGLVVAGKLLAVYLVTILACILLLVLGMLVFSMDLGRPGALAVHIMATMLMTTGIMTLCFGLIRSERAADAIVSVLIIVMALVGGSMLQIDMMGPAMRSAARLSPVYWANTGFRALFIEGAGLAEIRLNILVLCAVGAATLLPGTWLLGRSMRKGGG